MRFHCLCLVITGLFPFPLSQRGACILHVVKSFQVLARWIKRECCINAECSGMPVTAVCRRDAGTQMALTAVIDTMAV